MKNKKPFIGITSLLASTFLYSTYSIFPRVVGFSIPLFYQGIVRSFFAALILVIFILWLKQWKKINKKDLLWFISRTFFGCLCFVSFYIAINYVTISYFYFIYFAGSTIGGYLIGRLLFGEAFTQVKIFSLFLSIAGLLLIYSINFDAGSYLYLLLSLISGFSVAVWNTFSKKISGQYPAVQLNFMDHFISGLIYIPASFLVGEVWLAPVLSTQWLAIFGLGAIMVLTGQLVVWGFYHLEAQIGSLIMLSEILFALILGYLVYQESISLPTMIGGLLIITAMILPELNFRKK